MIRSLEDARDWYEAVLKLVGMMDRMARRYWGEEAEGLTLKETLHQDNVFRHLESATIQDLAKRVIEDLDDLAVLLLFSVFEAAVRERTLEEMDRELDKPPRHLVLKKAVGDAKDAVGHGSFGRLTESYRELDPDTRTLVDQVRHYRNWVAHGRRGPVKNNVDPDSAMMRLERFLKLLDAAAATAAATAMLDPVGTNAGYFLSGTDAGPLTGELRGRGRRRITPGVASWPLRKASSPKSVSNVSKTRPSAKAKARTTSSEDPGPTSLIQTTS